MSAQNKINNNTREAFTIVELLVVIVVIAILAAITIVSYTNITAQANTSSVKSTLSQAIKGLEDYKIAESDSETYPSSSVFSSLNIANDSNNISYTYYPSDDTDTPSSYCLEGTTNSTTFSISSTDEAVVNKPCTENSLVGWWKMNGDATDSSGNGNNGTVVGATSTIGEDGSSSGAYSFDGNDYINIASASDIRTSGNFTTSVWIKIPAYPSGWEGVFFGKGIQLDSIWYGMSFCVWGSLHSSNVGKVAFYTQGAVPAHVLVATYSSTVLSLDTWYYAVATYEKSSGMTKVFLNGALEASRVYVTNLNDDTISTNIGVWYNHSYDYFNGIIDDVRFYNRALSASEISALYAAGAQ